MPRPARLSTKHSTYSVISRLLLFLFPIILVLAAPARAADGAADLFRRGLDAYFAERPYQAAVLVRDAMTARGATALREPGLYVTGKSFAAIHLYEKAEDSMRGLLNEYPNGRFAPVALRELARIFFDLREFGAVVNLEQSYRRQHSAGNVPAEFWYLVGQSNYLLNRKAEAQGALQRVPPGDPFYPFARFTLAQVEFSLGRSDGALASMAAVASASDAPELLRERAVRTTGMMLYQQKRYAESMRTYDSIASGSPLWGPTRIDLALAAEAAGDTETVRRALGEAMEGADDELLRAEAQVAFGRLFTRQERAGTARTLFDKALGDLRSREARLRQAIDTDSAFREAFAELVAFARQSRLSLERQRLAGDLDLLRSSVQTATGEAYQHAPITAPEKISPKSYLFPLLHRHFHNPAIIENLVDLTVEIEDLQKAIGVLESEIRGEEAFSSTTPLKTSQVPEGARLLTPQMIWLSFAHFDLTSRFFDSLAVSEKIAPKDSMKEKQRALGHTIESLRLIQFGRESLPTKEAFVGMMDQARVRLASGELPGMMSQKVRQGFLEQWQTDRDSLSYVVDNLNLKERQMAGALTGVPLRSRNLNLPVLTTMSDWLAVLEQLDSKYRYIEFERDERPWHLTGHGGQLAALLGRDSQELATLRERAMQVLKGVARQLIEKEQIRHSLIVAEAEEGIADALFEERSSRE